jgi:plastocyanin
VKKLALLGLGLIASAAIAAVPLHGRDASAATHGVSVTEYMFTDAGSSTSTTTVGAGDSVLWTWNGAEMHSVTADDGSFDHPASPDAQSNGTYGKTFDTPGTYAYYCRIHGATGGQGMSGTIVVQAAATDTATATATATNTASAATMTTTPTPGGSVTATSTPSGTDTATAPAGTTPAPSPAASTPAGAATVATTAGGAAGVDSLPRAGDGGAGGTTRFPILSIALAIVGAAVLAAAVLAPRRR